MLYPLDAKSGEVLWEREAHRGKPFGGRHRKNTYFSETPVTDGERVYAYFGNVGLYCYSMKGELIWKKQWEPQKIYSHNTFVARAGIDVTEHEEIAQNSLGEMSFASPAISEASL